MAAVLIAPRLAGRTTVQFWLTAGVAVIAPLPFGSVGLFWIALWVVLLSVGCLLGSFADFNHRQFRLLCLFFLVVAAYASVAIIQILPAPDWLPTNPIWSEASKLLDTPLVPRVSVRGSIPTIALGSLLLFTLAFTNGYIVGGNADRSVALFRLLAYSGAVYAVYGLLSNALTPTGLLWREKTAYVGSVTGTFVNRNTAASYFGACSIVWFALIARRLPALQLISFKVAVLAPLPGRDLGVVVFRTVGFAICLAATIGTGSRAGGLLTLAALALTAWLIYANRLRGILMKIAVPVAIGALGSAAALGHLAIGRAQSEGLFDAYRLATYRSAFRLVMEHPWLGVGLGSFGEVFPSVRTGEVAIWGIWDKAHSTALEIAVEMGLPIAALVCGVAAILFISIVRSTIQENMQRRSLLAATAGLSALGLSHSLIDFPLQIPGFAVIFAIVTACGIARSTSERTTGSVALPYVDTATAKSCGHADRLKI